VPETWIVEALDVACDGACYVDEFTGTGTLSTAKDRAIAYARASYGTVRVEESPDPPPTPISPELRKLMDEVAKRR
jgi:hypothetical protein